MPLRGQLNVDKRGAAAASPGVAPTVAASTTGLEARGDPRGSTGTLRYVLRAWSRIGGLLAAVIACAIVFEGLNTAFLSSANILTIFKTTSSLGIIAMGEMAVLLVGEIDLSVGSIYGLGAMAIALLWVHGVPFVLACLAGLGIGCGAGLINGIVTTYIGVNSFITTLGMLNLAEGITFLVSNSASINPLATDPGYSIFKAFGQDQVFGQVPVQIFWLLGIAVIMYLVVHRSMFGFKSAAIGGNGVAAKVVGLPVRRYKIIAFGLSGTLAVLAGIIAFSLVGATSPTAGSSLPFTVFAAVIIGGASLSGGRGTVWGTFLGALFLTLISNGLSLLGYGPFVQLIFVGAVIVVAVAVDRLTSRGRDRQSASVQW